MIVAAQLSDLPRMAAMAGEFYQSTEMLRDFDLDRFIALWTGLLTTGSGAIFLLIDRGGIQGTIGGVVYPEQYSGELIAQEFFWFVHEQQRGHGVRLYKRFEQWAYEMNCKEIRMGHLADLMPEKVGNFYRRLGFSIVETNYGKRLDGAQMRKAG